MAASVDTVGVARLVILLLPMSIAPVILPPALGSLVAIEVVIVVEKEASLPSAAANSLRVSSVAGADATRLEIDVST